MSRRRPAPTHPAMRIAHVTLLALAVACSSSPDDGSSGTPGGAGSTAAGGAASTGGSTSPPSAGTTTTGGTPASGAGGSSSTAGTAMAGAATAGGNAAGGNAAGGNAAGGNPAGGKAGASTGGASGTSTGGSGGSVAGSGGAGSCVKNLACKLDPPPSTGDLQQDCVDRINQFLTKCACLPALKRRTDGEDCANQMAKYDADHNEAHAGFSAEICKPSGSQNSCPGYSSNQQVIGLCMQQMWNEGPPPTPDCTGQCYQTHGHFINMTDDSVTQVACGFYTTSAGKVWAVQNFSR